MNPTTTLLASAALVFCGFAAHAQDATPAPMEGMDHSTTAHGASSDAMQGYMSAMDTMSSAMAEMDPTGDADIDYLMMMIPHHQSAVDMSRALLPEAKDSEVRALAEAVIASQEAEIASMEAMLARLGHPLD